MRLPSLPAPNAPRNHSEARWAGGWALLTLLVTCLPYLFALSVAYPNRFFVGSLHLPDDAYVYLAWMRQAQEGRLTFENRFTTDPQTGGFFNLLFLLLGNLSRFSGLSVVWVFHLARVAFGIAFLLTAYRLLRRLLPEERSRKAAYLLLCFSAGLGVLFPRVVMASPTDLWQTETNTFLSLYMNPLFAAALWLMVTIFERMWAAWKAKNWKPALVAGLAGLALANIHSYDILIVWAVWAAFLLAALAYRLEVRKADYLSAVLLLVMPIPAVWQQWRFFQLDAVFRARALTPTPSPGLHWYLLGLGLLVPLAVYGIGAVGKDETKERRAAIVFLLAWAVVGLAMPYLPFSFGRKLAMGIHIPWAILAGMGLNRLAARAGASGKPRWGAVVAVGVLLTTPTLFRWFSTAFTNVQNNWCEGLARLILSPDETAVMNWISKNAEGEPVIAAPLYAGGVAGYLPALGGVKVYAGHWSETPDWESKRKQILRFYSSAMPDDDRRDFLKQAHVRYVYWSFYERNLGRHASGDGPAPADLSQMAGLRLVFQSGSGDERVSLFRVE